MFIICVPSGLQRAIIAGHNNNAIFRRFNALPVNVNARGYCIVLRYLTLTKHILVLPFIFKSTRNFFTTCLWTLKTTYLRHLKLNIAKTIQMIYIQFSHQQLYHQLGNVSHSINLLICLIFADF